MEEHMYLAFGSESHTYLTVFIRFILQAYEGRIVFVLFTAKFQPLGLCL